MAISTFRTKVLRLKSIAISGHTHAWLFIGLLVLLTAFLANKALVDRPPLAHSHWPFWLIFGLFCVATLTGMSTLIGTQATQLQITEIVEAFALVFSTPKEIFIAVILSRFIGHARRGRPVIKAVFNIAQDMLMLVIAIWIASTFVEPGNLLSQRSLLGLSLALLVYVPGSILVSIVIWAYTHQWNKELLSGFVVTGLHSAISTVAAICSLSLFLVGLYAFALWVLTLAGFLFFLQAYFGQHGEQIQIQRMHELTTGLLVATNLTEATGEYLSRVAELFHAATAALCLFTDIEAKDPVHVTVWQKGAITSCGIRKKDVELLPPLVQGFNHEGIFLVGPGVQTNPLARNFLLETGASVGAIGRIGNEAEPLGLVAIGMEYHYAPKLRSQVGLLLPNLTAQTAIALQRSHLATALSRMAAEEAAFEEKAMHDSLTGLANRELFTKRLGDALSSATLLSQVAVLFIDLDGFKAVNDTYGHAGGDALLIEISSRLQTQIREHDLAARFGGDEFAVLLTEVAGDNAANNIANRILEAIRVPVRLANGYGHVRASIGIIQTPFSHTTSASLLKAADEAMYAAKRAGKDQIVRTEIS